MLDFAITVPAEISPLVGRGRAQEGENGSTSLATAERDLTAWLAERQRGLRLGDEEFARFIGVGASEWRHLRARDAHYDEDWLYAIASRLPDGLPLIVDVSRHGDGWSIYDTWLLWGVASTGPYPRLSRIA